MTLSESIKHQADSIHEANKSLVPSHESAYEIICDPYGDSINVHVPFYNVETGKSAKLMIHASMTIVIHRAISILLEATK